MYQVNETLDVDVDCYQTSAIERELRLLTKLCFIEYICYMWSVYEYSIYYKTSIAHHKITKPALKCKSSLVT